MNTESYNGWTNYATWRVNLEIFSGFNPLDYFPDDFKYCKKAELKARLCAGLKTYAQEIVLSYCGDGGLNTPNLAADFAMAFLDDVDWYEIAEHMIKEYSSEELV